MISRMMTWFRNYELIWGMPGSRWEHHDGPFQVPKHFRLVYRLHEMILGEQEIIEPGTDRLLDRIELLKFVSGNTRDIVERFGYETLAYSFVKKSAGALKLHNFPRALTRFENQLDGTLTDLAERDIFRERTDGTGTYNEFRQSLGEPPVTSFMELTGGDAELAREIELKYEGDINAVDAGIGILAQPKPAGFALGFDQFYQFVLNAPRRVKSNRLLTEGFTYDEYQEGMDWIEHSGGMLGVMARHLRVCVRSSKASRAPLRHSRKLKRSRSACSPRRMRTLPSCSRQTCVRSPSRFWLRWSVWRRVLSAR